MARSRKPKPSMKRVAEGIYQRPSGRYVVPIYDPQTGKKRYAWPGVPKGGFPATKEGREQAEAFKRRMEDEKRDRGSSRETADSFAGRWMDDYPGRRGESTRTHNRERVGAFSRDFAGRPLDDVSRKEARLWVVGGNAPRELEQRARRWEGSTAENGRVVVVPHRGNLAAVRAMYNDAVRDDVAKTNPFAGMGESESKGREGILVLTGDEVPSLVRTAEAVWVEGRYGARVFGPMILVAAYTGLRPGELYALKWSRIDFEADELHVLKQWNQKTKSETLPKHGKTRTITLLPQARAALQRVAQVRQTGHDYVFSIQSGGRFTQRLQHYYWDPVRKAFWGALPAGRQQEIDPGFDFYELRHFYGTHLATHYRVSPYEGADQMGHVDGGVLFAKRYVHPVSRDVRARLRDRIRDEQMLGVADDAQRRQTG